MASPMDDKNNQESKQDAPVASSATEGGITDGSQNKEERNIEGTLECEEVTDDEYTIWGSFVKSKDRLEAANWVPVEGSSDGVYTKYQKSAQEVEENLKPSVVKTVTKPVQQISPLPKLIGTWVKINSIVPVEGSLIKLISPQPLPLPTPKPPATTPNITKKSRKQTFETKLDSPRLDVPSLDAIKKDEKNIHKPRKQIIEVNNYVSSSDDIFYVSCKNCKKSFPSDDQYQEHRTPFDPEFGRSMCKLCKEPCAHACEVYTHYLYHTTYDKANICLLTKYDFMNSLPQIIDYIKLFDAHGVGQFFCVCNQWYDFRNKLIHHVEHAYENCKRIAQRISSIPAVHKQKCRPRVDVVNRKPLKYRRCIVNQRIEKQITNVPPKCRICKLEFDNRRVYLEHVRFEHIETYYCEHCARDYTCKKKLQRHMIASHLKYTVTTHKVQLL